MTQDLVNLVMQRLGPAVLERLSVATGTNQDTLEKAASGAVPALLAGLAGVATRVGGGDRLATALRQFDPGMLDAVFRPSGDGVQQDVIDKGRALLASLFGSQGAKGLADAVGLFSGLSQGAVATLLGFLTSLTFAMLDRQQQSAGPGGGGIAQILLDQKDKIAAALPPGLANNLYGSGMLSGIVDQSRQGAEATTVTPPAATTLGPGATPTPLGLASGKTTTDGVSRWILGLAAAVIVAILAYWVLSPSKVEEVRRPPADSTAPPNSSGTSMGVSQLELARQLTMTIDTTRQALQGVNDAASAKQALPKLNDAIVQLSSLSGERARASPADRKALADMVTKSAPPLQDVIDQAMAKPGVAEVLKPTLDTFKAKLADLSAT